MSNHVVYLNPLGTTITVGDGLTGTGTGGDPVVVSADGSTIQTAGGAVAVVDPLVLGGVQAAFTSSDGSAGVSTTVTTASLVGKTLTFKDGIATGFA